MSENNVYQSDLLQYYDVMKDVNCFDINNNICLYHLINKMMFFHFKQGKQKQNIFNVFSYQQTFSNNKWLPKLHNNFKDTIPENMD